MGAAPSEPRCLLQRKYPAARDDHFGAIGQIVFGELGDHAQAAVDGPELGLLIGTIPYNKLWDTVACYGLWA